MAASLIGQFLGKYKIVDELGHGGMAAVYRGYQEDVGRYVAVKVLPPHPGQSRQFVERFRLEARTIARLQHPHILPLYDYGDRDDILYLVTPYIQGGSLRERIQDGPLPLNEIAHLLTQTASALDYAHRNGVVHRDIKPGNILLSTEGDVVLADFGIVKMVEGSAGLTVTDGVVGTPSYMSPEQGQGITVDARSDIYSLGVVVYEMLTGQLPYTAETPMQVLFKHITEPLPRISDVVEGLPPAVEPVMMRVLAKDAEARYQSSREFAADFAGAVESGGGSEVVRPVQAAPEVDATAIAVPRDALQPAVSSTVSGGQATAETPLTSGRGMITWIIGGGSVLVLLVVIIVLLVVSLNRDPVIVIANPTAVPTATVQNTAPPVVQISTATTAPQAPTVPPAVVIEDVGGVTFGSTAQAGDTVTVQVQDLAAPAGDAVYMAWLTQSADPAQVLALGQLAVDADGLGSLSYIDPAGQVLPALFDTLLITQEDSAEAAAPGEVLYSGVQAPGLSDALYALLILDPDTGREDRSLLADAIAEAEFAARHVGLASGSGNAGGLHTHTEHAINILLGTQDDLNGDGSPQNPGLGFGVPLFMDAISARLDGVATGDWPELRGRLESVRVCIVNTEDRVRHAVALGQNILATDDVDAMMGDATRAGETVNEMLTGFDLNSSGQVDPFEGECGLEQIADYSVLMGSMVLVEGAPE